jgi:hypothetical protein
VQAVEPTWLSTRSAAARKGAAGLLLLLLCLAWIILAETSQAVQAANYKKVRRRAPLSVSVSLSLSTLYHVRLYAPLTVAPPPGQPYFLAWLAHSAYVLFLPLFVAVQYLRRRTSPRALQPTARPDPPLSQPVCPGRDPTGRVRLFPWRLYWRQSVALGTLTFFVLYLWYLSLDRTRVAPNTSIYQSACVFVYGRCPCVCAWGRCLIRPLLTSIAWLCVVAGFSVWLFHERVTLPRVGAVVLCLAGVFMVAFGSTSGDDAVCVRVRRRPPVSPWSAHLHPPRGQARGKCTGVCAAGGVDHSVCGI